MTATYDALLDQRKSPPARILNPFGRPAMTTIDSASELSGPELRQTESNNTDSGLLIDLHPPPRRTFSGSFPTSPPIPAKSPLRSRSNQNVPTAPAPPTPQSVPSEPVTPPIPRTAAALSNASLAKSGHSSRTGSSSDSVLPSRSRRQSKSKFVEMESANTSDTGGAQPSPSASEIRFTSAIFPSIYSQDSSTYSVLSPPNSATTQWSQNDLSPTQSQFTVVPSEEAAASSAEREWRRSKRMDDLWGRKRGSKGTIESVEALADTKVSWRDASNC